MRVREGVGEREGDGQRREVRGRVVGEGRLFSLAFEVWNKRRKKGRGDEPNIGDQVWLMTLETK